jgi:hypothetical protein
VQRDVLALSSRTQVLEIRVWQYDRALDSIKRNGRVVRWDYKLAALTYLSRIPISSEKLEQFSDNNHKFGRLY